MVSNQYGVKSGRFAICVDAVLVEVIFYLTTLGLSVLARESRVVRRRLRRCFVHISYTSHHVGRLICCLLSLYKSMLAPEKYSIKVIPIDHRSSHFFWRFPWNERKSMEDDVYFVEKVEKDLGFHSSCWFVWNTFWTPLVWLVVSKSPPFWEDFPFIIHDALKHPNRDGLIFFFFEENISPTTVIIGHYKHHASGCFRSI